VGLDGPLPGGGVEVLLATPVQAVTASGPERRGLSGPAPPAPRAAALSVGKLCQPRGPDGEGQARGKPGIIPCCVPRSRLLRNPSRHPARLPYCRSGYCPPPPLDPSYESIPPDSRCYGSGCRAQ